MWTNLFLIITVINMENYNNGPRLTEVGVRSYIGTSLKEYHKFRNNNTTIIFNIMMFIGFVALLSGILYWRYKGHINPRDTEIKNRKKKEYIFTKLQTLAELKKLKKTNMITDLPTWENDPNIKMLDRNNV